MDLNEIQTRLDALAVAMSERGLKNPKAEFHIESGKCQCVILMWQPASGSGFEWFRSDVATALDNADAYVAALPTPEEHHRNEFLRLASVAADYGNAHGIDAEFVNPITEAMKRISSNAIAAE